jgi:hypothetical protein
LALAVLFVGAGLATLADDDVSSVLPHRSRSLFRRPSRDGLMQERSDRCWAPRRTVTLSRRDPTDNAINANLFESAFICMYRRLGSLFASLVTGNLLTPPGPDRRCDISETHRSVFVFSEHPGGAADGKAQLWRPDVALKKVRQQSNAQSNFATGIGVEWRRRRACAGPGHGRRQGTGRAGRRPADTTSRRATGRGRQPAGHPGD